MKTFKKFLSLILIPCFVISALLFFNACNTPSSVNPDGEQNGGYDGPDGSIGDSVTVDVTDFGADPSGANDCAEAIQSAVRDAKKYAVGGRSVTIDFPKGVYNIYPDRASERTLFISNTTGASLFNRKKKIGILLEGLENVTVNGNGSQFMFHGKMTAFACIDCKNVTFKNFEVDFKVPTVIDVTVEELVGTNCAIISIPECYNYSVSSRSIKFFSDNSPYTGEPYWTLKKTNIKYTQRLDKNTGLAYRGNLNDTAVFSHISKIQDLGDNRIKITYNRRSGEIIEGMCFQMRPTVRDHAGSFLWKSKDVSLKNLDIRFLHGFGVVGQSSENIALDDVDFETDVQRGNSTAGYADFVQMSGCKGKIDIGNCTFSNPHDDPINIHGTYLQVVAICKNKVTVRFKHGETAGFPNFFEGDKIEFIDNRTLTPVADSGRTVVHVDGPDGMGGEMGKGSVGPRTIVLTLDSAPPSGIAPLGAYYVENVTCSPDVRIHDNAFKQISTRGILATTRGEIVIENNTFDGMGMAGIFVSNDANDWYESSRVENLTIRNNVFKRSQAQAILIEPTNRKVSPSAPVHFNISIENNTFYVDNNYAVEAKSVRGLRITNNTLYMQNVNLNAHFGEDVSPSTTQESTENIVKCYRLRGCTNAIFDSNVYQNGVTPVIEYSDMNASDIALISDISIMTEVSSENGFNIINLSWIIPTAVIALSLIILIPIIAVRKKRKQKQLSQMDNSQTDNDTTDSDITDSDITDDSRR